MYKKKNPKNRSGFMALFSSWNIGILVLAIYLILVGLATIAGLVIPPIAMGILALVAGIFLIIGR
jgi:hypothetical protein